MSFFFGYIWLFLLSTTEALPPYYTFAVWAVGLSCVIELSSLVVQLAASAFLFVRLKVRQGRQRLKLTIDEHFTTMLILSDNSRYDHDRYSHNDVCSANIILS